MTERPETFRSTGALVFGATTVVVALTLAVLAAVHPRAGAPAWVSVALVLLAVIVHIAQIRPAVQLRETDLVLRNMLTTVHLPWAAIESVRVRQFLTVRVAGRDHHCAAVGRTRRQIHREARPLVVDNPKDSAFGPLAAAGRRRPTEMSFGRLVETKIQNRAADARARAGIAAESAEQHALADDVRREPAWPEIGALVLALVALVVALVA